TTSRACTARAGGCRCRLAPPWPHCRTPARPVRTSPCAELPAPATRARSAHRPAGKMIQAGIRTGTWTSPARTCALRGSECIIRLAHQQLTQLEQRVCATLAVRVALNERLELRDRRHANGVIVRHRARQARGAGRLRPGRSRPETGQRQRCERDQAKPLRWHARYRGGVLAPAEDALPVVLDVPCAAFDESSARKNAALADP